MQSNSTITKRAAVEQENAPGKESCCSEPSLVQEIVRLTLRLNYLPCMAAGVYAAKQTGFSHHCHSEYFAISLIGAALCCTLWFRVASKMNEPQQALLRAYLIAPLSMLIGIFASLLIG
ncbi:MAG: hypothetical protein K2X27_08135 [Candidatus Obscuribacterales bacterium]|nr:hypothetical protein [Candidatus Obscuribacterales bacterium]